MNKKLLWTHIARIVIFLAIGLTMFTENVRTVQILGLFASGMVVGVSLGMIIADFKSRQKSTV